MRTILSVLGGLKMNKKILLLLCLCGLSSLAATQNVGFGACYIVGNPNCGPGLGALVVTPSNPQLLPGATIQLQAEGQMNDAAQSDAGPYTAQCDGNWTSSNTAVATVGLQGLVTGVAAGTATIGCGLPAPANAGGSITVTVLPTPQITNPSCGTPPCILPQGTNGTAYATQTFLAVGGVAPYTWSVSAGSLPTGLTLSTGGVLSGTPTVNGTSAWTVQVLDSGANPATVQVTLTVVASAGCGAPGNYCANTSTSIAPWPNTIPNAGTLTKPSAPFYDTSLTSSNPPPFARCTDFSIESGATSVSGNALSKSAGLGGSGEALGLWNSNDTMLHFNTSGGGGRIVLFNPNTMVCGDPVTGWDITAVKKTPPGSSTTSYGFGGGAFSWTDAEAPAGYSAWYAISGLDVTSSTQVAQYFIKQIDGTFTVTPSFIDFSYGLPLGTRAPAWQNAHPYTAGQYVSVTLSLPAWNGTAAYIAGDLIKPGDSTTNPLGCAFKLSIVGIRGTQPTTWSKSTDTNCVTAQTKPETNASCTSTSPCETWRNIGNSGTFAFQALTSGNSGSGPTWATVPTGGITVHPDLMSPVTDGGVTWENVGPVITPTWNSFAGISKDSNRIANAFSSNSYGHGTGSYNNDNSGQGTGNYAVAYDISANKFVLLNTLTGFQTTITCSGGTGYACTGFGAQQVLTTPSTPITAISTCSFPVHNSKGGSTMDYIVVARQGTYGAAGCPGSIGNGPPNMLDWQPFAAYNAATSGALYNTKSNHWAIGKKLLVNVGDRTLPGWGAAGAWTTLLQSDNPTGVPVTSWQVSPCAATGVWVANSPNPPCDFGLLYDSHLAIWHTASDDDTGPLCGTIFDLTTGDPRPIGPYVNEEICVTSSPSWALGAPIGTYKVWRFGHNFLTLSNPFFDVQFGISQLSTTGKFLAFSSDWNCTLGTTSGTAGPPLCGYNWHQTTFYAANTMLNPFSSLGGSGTNFGVWQVVNSGTSGTGTVTNHTWAGPICNATNVNATYTDSASLLYKCLGPNNTKGEVFIVGLR